MKMYRLYACSTTLLMKVLVATASCSGLTMIAQYRKNIHHICQQLSTHAHPLLIPLLFPLEMVAACGFSLLYLCDFCVVIDYYEHVHSRMAFLPICTGIQSRMTTLPICIGIHSRTANNDHQAAPVE